MSADTKDTLRDTIAELIGKKPSDLKPGLGDNVIRNWRVYLAEHGNTLKSHAAADKIQGRHIVVYSDVRGDTQAVLSDSDTAQKVRPIARLSVSKAAKAGDQKDA